MAVLRSPASSSPRVPAGQGRRVSIARAPTARDAEPIDRWPSRPGSWRASGGRDRGVRSRPRARNRVAPHQRVVGHGLLEGFSGSARNFGSARAGSCPPAAPSTARSGLPATSGAAGANLREEVARPSTHRRSVVEANTATQTPTIASGKMKNCRTRNGSFARPGGASILTSGRWWEPSPGGLARSRSPSRCRCGRAAAAASARCR
jgi:hypothetical protein